MAKRTEVFAQRLRAMQEQVSAAMQTYTTGGTRVPDGVYIAREAAEIREARSTGKLMISRTFTVAEGEFTGLNIWDNLMLESESEVPIQIARRWVELHIDPSTGSPYVWPEEDLAKLETIVNEISEAAALVKIRVKTTPNRNGDGEWTNVTVLQLLDASPDQARPEQEPERAAEPSDESATSDGLDEMDRTALKAFIAKNRELAAAIRVKPKMTDDDIRSAIREALGNKDSEPESEKEAVDVNAILAFCSSQGIDEAKEGMAVEELVEIMSGYGFHADELMEDEVKLLKTLGLEGNIQQQLVQKPVEQNHAPKPHDDHVKQKPSASKPSNPK